VPQPSVQRLRVLSFLRQTARRLVSLLAYATAHVRDKIRQQLQVLRDLGLLDFLGSGSYRLR